MKGLFDDEDEELECLDLLVVEVGPEEDVIPLSTVPELPKFWW